MRPPLPPGPFLVVGLVRSGRAAALALRASGAAVIGCDRATVAPEIRRELEAAGVAVFDQTDGVALLDDVATVIKSPGVPRQAPVIARALERSLTVIGELELGWRMLENPVLAVTGSNGKTTTTELIGRIYAAADEPARVAGNVGTALTSLIGDLDRRVAIICEVSSFQLEDSELFAPELAVLVNLAPDHLDRHGSFVAYREAKLRIFSNQGPEAVAVLAPGEDVPGAARRVSFSIDDPSADAAVIDGAIRWRGEAVIDVSEIRLRGVHNLQNALAATAVALTRGLPVDAVRSALADFGGVRHRLEEVAKIADVLYINDSKATNVASAAVGIGSFDGGLHAILGGRGKGEDYAPLAQALRGRARAAYLIGEEAAAIARALSANDPYEIHICETLERALQRACAAAQPGDVILLSPACASYDQFHTYEERGDSFSELVSRSH